MADTFPSAWTTGDNAIQSNVGLQPIVEIIIDPDGINKKVDGYHDIKSMSVISNNVEIDPMNLGEIFLSDMQLVFNDPDEFLSLFSHRETEFRPFRACYNVIKGFNDMSGYYWDLALYDTIWLEPFLSASSIYERFLYFDIGDRITISDGTNKETKRILHKRVKTYHVGTNLFQDQQIAVSKCTNTYAAGDLVSIEPYIGKKVEIKLRLKNYVGTLTVFTGIIREPFEYQNGQAILKIDNLLADVLNKPIKIKSGSTTPLQITDSSGALTSSIAYSSGAGVTLADVTIYTGANLGAWTVTFSSATDFVVSGPNCNDKAGDINTDFYDQTDATDSQIKIASADWGGTPAANEVVSFYVSANFENMSVPEIGHDLLSVYGETTEIDVDSAIDSGSTVYSFNTAYNQYSGESISISFSEAGTIGQALNIVTPHALCYPTQNHGKIALFALRPFGNYESPPGTGGPVTTVNQRSGLNSHGQGNFYNEIIVNYGYDYTTGAYQFQIVYPEKDSDNKSYHILGTKRPVEINMPGIYSESDALTCAKRYYAMWHMGFMKYSIDTDLAMVNCDVGDVLEDPFLAVASYPPSGLVYSVEKHLMNNYKVILKCLVMPHDLYGYWA